MFGMVYVIEEGSRWIFTEVIDWNVDILYSTLPRKDRDVVVVEELDSTTYPQRRFWLHSGCIGSGLVFGRANPVKASHL